MLSLSPLKIVIVLVVALVLVGPDKLPGLARQIGGAWRAFRSFSSKVETEVRSTMPDLPSTGDIARLARSPVAFLDSLAELNTDPLVPDSGAVASAQGDALRADPGAPITDDEPAFGDPTASDDDEDASVAATAAVDQPWEDPLVPSEPSSPRPAPTVRPLPPSGPGSIDPSLN